jgi:hypothetical protein
MDNQFFSSSAHPCFLYDLVFYPLSYSGSFLGSKARGIKDMILLNLMPRNARKIASVPHTRHYGVILIKKKRQICFYLTFIKTFIFENRLTYCGVFRQCGMDDIQKTSRNVTATEGERCASCFPSLRVAPHTATCAVTSRAPSHVRQPCLY